MIPPQFPTESEFLQSLYERQISPLIQELNAAKQVVDSHRTPTSEDIERYLATTDDSKLLEKLAYIAKLESEIATIRCALEEVITNILHSPANADERQAARTKFNAIKRRLTESLHSLGDVAAHESALEVHKWIDNAFTLIPKLNTTSNNHDLKTMREWLQKHHPEANIKSRGVIPEKWRQVYYRRTE